MIGRNKKTVNVVTLAPSSLLEGRKALITGGTGGIGKAIAEAFLNAGADVIITSRSKEKAEACAEELGKKTPSGRNICGLELDLSVPESISGLLSVISTVPWIGNGIDILINNAGTNVGESYYCNECDYDTIVDTNLKGVYFLTRQIGEYMISKGIEGNILNITSSSGLRPAISPYMISKWGVRGLTLGFAKKYIKHGIVVNALAPGPTATPMLKKSEKDDLNLPNNPSKRFALPQEIYNFTFILTSDIFIIIVGYTIYMTGGAGVITFDDVIY